MTAFATIDQLSAYLRFTIAEDDAFAQLALDGATQAIRKYTGQHLTYVADETVTLDGSGSDVMLLPEVPVVDVSQVIEWVNLDTARILLDNSHLSQSEYDWTDAGLLIRRLSSFVTYSDSRASARYGLWPDAPQSVQATYSHGFRLGNTTEAVTAPGGAANTHLPVQGYDSSTCTLLYVVDETASALVVATEDGSGIRVTTDTTGHVLLVTFTRLADEFPADISMICVTTAARAIGQDGGEIEATGSYNVTYAGQPGTLTDNEKRILDRYRTRRK